MMFKLIEHFDLLRPGKTCLHFAPEHDIAPRLRAAWGDGYDPVDLDADRYGFANARRFDLCRDSFKLEDQRYDLILHNHVFEHIPCNYGAVFLQLRRSLKIGGMHIFSVPVHLGRYAEDQNPLSKEDREKRFGQHDHVRRFGIDDYEETIGSLVDLSNASPWDQMFPASELTEMRIRQGRWERGALFMLACRRMSVDLAKRDQLIAPVSALLSPQLQTDRSGFSSSIAALGRRISQHWTKA
jgi:phosphoglycolate phosphatase